jgi:hypothetical protein
VHSTIGTTDRLAGNANVDAKVISHGFDPCFENADRGDPRIEMRVFRVKTHPAPHKSGGIAARIHGFRAAAKNVVSDIIP